MERKLTDDERKLWQYAMENFQIVYVRPRIEIRETIIDLHGYTLQSAYNKTYDFVYGSYIYNIKQILIITGKSGEICTECKRWLETDKFLNYIRRSQLLNDGGAIKVFLKR